MHRWCLCLCGRLRFLGGQQSLPAKQLLGGEVSVGALCFSSQAPCTAWGAGRQLIIPLNSWDGSSFSADSWQNIEWGRQTQHEQSS